MHSRTGTMYFLFALLALSCASQLHAQEPRFDVVHRHLPIEMQQLGGELAVVDLDGDADIDRNGRTEFMTVVPADASLLGAEIHLQMIQGRTPRFSNLEIVRIRAL